MRRNLITRKPIRTLTVSPSGADFNSIQTAIDSASEDDLLIVYPGTYDERLILKNSVNIFCFPGVTISSASESGTISDNDNPVIMSLSGFPTIVNGIDDSKRIILQQSDSIILSLHETLLLSSSTLLQYQSTAFVDANSQSLNITLPLAQKFTSKNFLIKKIDSSSNTVTVLPYSDELILGGDHYTLSQQYASINLVSDGSAWY